MRRRLIAVAAFLFVAALVAPAQATTVRLATWQADPDTGRLSFVPGTGWYPDANGVLITLDGRTSTSALRPSGYDPTGPREGSTFEWYENGYRDARDGDVFEASGVDTDGVPFAFRRVHSDDPAGSVTVNDDLAAAWAIAPDGSVVFTPVDFVTTTQGVRFTFDGTTSIGAAERGGVPQRLPYAGADFRFVDARLPLDVGDVLVAEGFTIDWAPFRFEYVHGTTSATAAPTPSDGTHRIIWASSRNGESRGALDAATVDVGFDARLEVDGGPEIERVEWYIDGRLFRDDDVLSPYNLRYTGTIPLDATFGSDQDGVDGEWHLAPDSVHGMRALIVLVSGETITADAWFAIDGRAGSPSTTTQPPPPRSTTPPPQGDDRPVVFADGDTVLDQPNTIYDFQGGSPGEVVILASNVEARNIRGGGARRIGARDGRSITDSGFRDFEFTFAHVQMANGATVTRPYFVDGTDVNAQPHTGEGDIIQIFAYEGDIIDPLIDNVVVYGKRRPSGSPSHNDGIQFTGILGGEVWNPTVRNSTVEGAASAGIQAKHVHGVFTIEGNRLSERYGSFHAVIAKPGDGDALMLWRDNTLVDGASAALTDGWNEHPDSDGSVEIR